MMRQGSYEAIHKKLVMVETKKQSTNNGQAQSFFFILMMESFGVFQLAGSFPSAHFQLLTVFGILETKSRR